MFNYYSIKNTIVYDIILEYLNNIYFMFNCLIRYQYVKRIKINFIVQCYSK